MRQVDERLQAADSMSLGLALQNRMFKDRRSLAQGYSVSRRMAADASIEPVICGPQSQCTQRGGLDSFASTMEKEEPFA